GMRLGAARLPPTTDLPSASLSAGATRRAAISVAPPGDAGTTIRIGRLGKGCAAATQENNRQPPMNADRRRAGLPTAQAPACRKRRTKTPGRTGRFAQRERPLPVTGHESPLFVTRGRARLSRVPA